MTPVRALDRDSREDIEGLIHRGRIILPEVILLDGTASTDQVATVPPGVDLDKAFLPYRERPGPPTGQPGAALVGTREPDIAPWLPGFGTAILGDNAYRHITRSQSRDDIMAWLYNLTGVRYAPAAFWRVAGWEIGWLANWLDRLLTGGAMGALIVAERQAAATVRAAWLAHKGAREKGSSLRGSGLLLAARALLDMLAAFDCVIDEAMHDPVTRAARPAIASAYAAIAQRLRSCIRAIEEAGADRTLGFIREQKAGKALDHARDIVDSIGLFTAVGEPIGDRVLRITQALPTKGRAPPPLDTTFAAVLADATTRIEQVIAAAPPPEIPAGWCREMIGDLTRLGFADPQQRLARLAQVRTDLVYKLVVTRRLDRTFAALPWMAAPSGAFRLTFGGPLGAIASIFEIARYREICVELTNRTCEPGSRARLDTTCGKTVYGDPVAVDEALRKNDRAGFWLATSALSHDMVQAFLAGLPFDAAHPMPALEAGRLDWAFERSMHDPATMVTVTDIELAKPIYATADYHRDLPRYMGLTVADVLTLGLADIFPGDFRDPGFNLFARRADERRKDLKIGSNRLGADQAGAANRELLRSILKSIDEPTDGNDADWRSTPIVNRSTITTELRRFDGRNVGHNGDREGDGSRIRRRAADIRKEQGDPGKTLRRLVDRARSWTSESDDRLLAELFSGRRRLSESVPVGQTGAPALWFNPAIDAHFHDWIASGAPMWAPIAIGNVVHAGLIAREVETVTAAMPLLFGMPVSPALRRRILVPVWTGLAGITEDHAHVR